MRRPTQRVYRTKVKTPFKAHSTSRWASAHSLILNSIRIPKKKMPMAPAVFPRPRTADFCHHGTFPAKKRPNSTGMVRKMAASAL
jgi:hypothetical protein